jgi:hypothetical protein
MANNNSPLVDRGVAVVNSAAGNLRQVVWFTWFTTSVNFFMPGICNFFLKPAVE